jgi:hypothetical protein
VCFDFDNVTDGWVHVPVVAFDSAWWCATFAIFTTDVPTFSRIRPSAFYDILNDSYDVTEEKTADRSAG